MKRFISVKTESNTKNIWISLCLFVLIISVFYAGVSSLAKSSAEEELGNLTQTLQEGIVHCYSIEGTYPESLSYLTEHYGITYDHDKYLVEYHPLGSNIMPDLTVLARNQ